MKKYVTHPSNVEWLRKHLQAEEDKEYAKDKGFIYFIKPYWFEIISNPNIEAERPVKGKWMVEGNRFFQWWDGTDEPPSWAVFFGFVKPVMERYFYEMDMSRTVFLNQWQVPILKNTRMLMMNMTS